MPGTLTPAQMFDHELNVVKGWPSPYVVDYTAPVAAAETLTIYKGMGVYLNSDGEFRLGSAAGAVTILVLQNQNDFDANSDVGNVSGGVMGGLPCVACFDVWTTEFVSGNYPPNTYLTVSNTPGYVGKLEEGAAYIDQICGIVNQGVFANDHTKNVLRFWTYHLPPMSTSSEEA